MATRKFGRAEVEVSIRDNVGKGLQAISMRMKNFGRGLKSVGVNVGAAGAGIAGAATAMLAPLGLAAKSFADFGDTLHKTSIRTGFSAAALSELKFAAEQSGTSIKQVGDAMFRANRRIANATSGTGPAVRALEELGISADKLNALDTDQKFMALAEALSSMDDKARAAQMGFEIFGDNFKQIQPLINEGATGIAKLRDEAKQLGITLSDDDAEAAAAFTDALNRMTQTSKAVMMQVGAALAPTLTKLADIFGDVATRVTSFIKNNRGLVVGLATAAAGAAAFGVVVMGLGAGIIFLGSVVSAVGAVIGALSVPVVIVGAALAAAVVEVAALAAGFIYIAHQAGLTQGAFEWLKVTFMTLLETVRMTFGGIMDALQAGRYQLAAQILWAGLKLAFLQGAQQVLKALSYLWNNAWDISRKFFTQLLVTVVKVFRKIPGLIKAVLTGGVSLGQVIAEAMSGDVNFDAMLEDPIKAARQDLQRLNQVASRARREVDPQLAGAPGLSRGAGNRFASLQASGARAAAAGQRAGLGQDDRVANNTGKTNALLQKILLRPQAGFR